MDHNNRNHNQHPPVTTSQHQHQSPTKIRPFANEQTTNLLPRSPYVGSTHNATTTMGKVQRESLAPGICTIPNWQAANGHRQGCTMGTGPITEFNAITINVWNQQSGKRSTSLAIIHLTFRSPNEQRPRFREGPGASCHNVQEGVQS